MATKNGCLPAKQTKLASVRKPADIITAIDYGSTHCSVYYSTVTSTTKNTEQNPPIPLKLEDKGLARIANCLLFSDELGKILAFGEEARNTYMEKERKDILNFYYFEHVKRIFQRERVNRSTIVKASNGKEFYLRDVISHTLHFLKTKLLDVLNSEGGNYSSTDIDWVITVPALWGHDGKQMMREAGYQAGLCSGGNPRPLQLVAPDREPTSVTERSPENLSIALEPESAAIYCHKSAKSKTKCYMVIDAGGGTIDLACHEIIKDHITVKPLPESGNNCGGVTINDEFHTFLSNLVDDNDFSEFIGTDESQQAECKALLGQIIYGHFERIKMQFGKQEEESAKPYYNLYLESPFCKTYEGVLNQLSYESENADVRYIRFKQQLQFSRKQMAEFFKKTMDAIVHLVETNLSSPIGNAIDTIYLVGGFGGSNYFQQYIENAIKKKYSKEYTVYIPQQPELAVANGAIEFRQDVNIVSKRPADATYGIAVNIPFIHGRHSEIHRFYADDYKQDYCKNVFKILAREGSEIHPGEGFSTIVTPQTFAQGSMTLTFYSHALKGDVMYVDDKGVREIGTITVILGGEGLKREVELVLDITSTELQVRAFDKANRKSEKIVILDFLSSYSPE